MQGAMEVEKKTVVRIATEMGHRMKSQMEDGLIGELSGRGLVDDSNSESDSDETIEPRKYDTSLHSEIPASRWCIDIHGLKYFENEVRRNLQDGALFQITNCKGFEESEKFHEPDIGPNIYEVVEHYISPFTAQQGGVSWALWWNFKQQKDNWWLDENGGDVFDCDLFATHAWKEGVFEFVGKVLKSWPIDATRLYVCFLGNPQNPGGIAEILKNPDLDESPFAQCLRTAKHVLVIPNSQTSIYTRLWCVFEAHKAIEANLDIRMPKSASPWTYFAIVLFGTVIFASFCAVGYFVVAPRIGFLMGPMLWIVAAYILNWVGKSFMDQVVMRRIPGSYRPKVQVVISYIQLAVIGTGAAISLWHLHGMAGRFADDDFAFKIGRDTETFFKGEGWACVPLILAFVASSKWHICSSLNQEVVNLEGAALNFDSVREADCNVEADGHRIRAAIRGKEDQIDTAIKTLKRIGRYDKNVADLLKSGLSPDFVREGFDPFQLIFIVYAWEYWLVVDLSANLHHYYAEFIPLGSCLLVLIIGYFVGLRIVFAIDVAQWFGFFYVVSSLLGLMFVGHEDPKNKYLSLQTLPELVVCFTIMGLVLVYHYSGTMKKHQDACYACCPQADPDDHESDEDEAYFIDCYREDSTESDVSSSPLLSATRSREEES